MPKQSAEKVCTDAHGNLVIHFCACVLSLTDFEVIIITIPQVTFENEISLRFLKLKYINARQNITYDCSNGKEAFEQLQVMASNGNIIKYGDKELRVVSEVSKIMNRKCSSLAWIISFSL